MLSGYKTIIASIVGLGVMVANLRGIPVDATMAQTITNSLLNVAGVAAPLLTILFRVQAKTIFNMQEPPPVPAPSAVSDAERERLQREVWAQLPPKPMPSAPPPSVPEPATVRHVAVVAKNVDALAAQLAQLTAMIQTLQQGGVEAPPTLPASPPVSFPTQ